MNHYIERARSGDPSATSIVIDSLRPRLARMAAYYARCCGEDPDDLLQEAWVGLLEALPAIDLNIGSPEQYLIRQAKWHMLDAIKRSKVRRCASLEQSAENSIPSGLLDNAVSKASVSEFARRLNNTQQAVFNCLLDGLTWREAGEVLGFTSANVAYHVRQIRRQYEQWDDG